MDDTQATRFSLLVRLRDGQDGQAWSEFVDIYSPVVYGFARRFGLQDADAADVAQEVFHTVARSIKNFECDRRRGSFRAWLMAVVRSRLNDFWAAAPRQAIGSGDTRVQRQLEAQSSSENDREIWEREYQESVLAWAAEQIRHRVHNSTWQAFWQTSVEGKTTGEVAKSLQMTEGAVYIAKCRVLARVREKIAELEDLE
jgi:RNA polymerase sigma-70 factor (ECF subfamily)